MSGIKVCAECMKSMQERQEERIDDDEDLYKQGRS
jgi:hypothetical protein